MQRKVNKILFQILNKKEKTRQAELKIHKILNTEFLTLLFLRKIIVDVRVSRKLGFFINSNF